MTKTLMRLLVVLNILILVWLLGSWIDVLIHNMDPNYIYSPMNFFSVLIGLKQAL